MASTLRPAVHHCFAHSTYYLATERCPGCAPHESAPFQKFWRCAHRRSAMENFTAQRISCEYGCHLQPLEWYHGGEHPQPKSWREQVPMNSRDFCGY